MRQPPGPPSRRSSTSRPGVPRRPSRRRSPKRPANAVHSACHDPSASGTDPGPAAVLDRLRSGTVDVHSSGHVLGDASCDAPKNQDRGMRRQRREIVSRTVGRWRAMPTLASSQFQPGVSLVILRRTGGERHNSCEGGHLDSIGRAGSRRPGQRAQRDHLRRAPPPRAPRTLRFRPRVKTPFTRRSLAQDGPATARTRPTSRGCSSQSMLADANEISQQFSGQGSMWQNPYAKPESARTRSNGVGVVHRLPAVADHPARRVVPQGDGRRGHCGRRSPRSASRPSTPARSSARAGSPAGSTTPSVDGHFDRISTQIDPAFGTEDEFRAMCGDRQLVRRHDHRRHRARPHRQGRRLPARRDEVRRLPRHLPHGRDRSRGLGAPARRARRQRTRSTSTPPPRSGWTRPATSSAGCSG